MKDILGRFQRSLVQLGASVARSSPRTLARRVCRRARQRVGLQWLMVALLGCLAGQSATARDWIDDLDQGKALAAKEGKDLMIVFTGTSWCAACMSLKREVLDQPDFAAVRDSFVPVVLEFPRDDKEIPPQRLKKYRAWQTQYHNKAVPTVVLADVAGRPYAITGYTRDTTAKDYLQLLHTLQDARRRRDAAFAKAAAANGLEKAKHLDEALSALSKAFSEAKTARQGDPLVHFYRPEIDQIFALDAKNQIGLRDKYAKRLDAEAERKKVADVLDRVRVVADKEGFPKALEHIDQELKAAKPGELRKQLLFARNFYLEWSGRNEDALASVHRILTDPGVSLSADERIRFRERIAFNLWRLKRIDEAVAVYDQLISEAAGNPHRVWSFHRDKADTLRGANRLRESLDTLNAARKYVTQGSEDWLTTEAFRIYTLIELHRTSEAEAAHQALVTSGSVKPLDLAGILVVEAWRFKRVGLHREALEKAQAAEKVLAKIRPDRVESRNVEEFRQSIKLLRDEINASDRSAGRKAASQP